MHDLIPLPAAGALTTADALTQLEVEAVLEFAENSKAAGRAYASNWRDFAAWCAARGASALQPPRPWSAATSRRSPTAG